MMSWQLNPYAIYLGISALVSGVISWLAWRRRPAPGAVPLSLLMLGAALWSLGYAIGTGFHDLAARVFWAQVQYLGIPLVPVATLLFVIEYIGYERWLTKRVFALLSAIPLATTLLAWSNDIHHLIWLQIEVKHHETVHFMSIKYGPFFWVHTIYSYILLVVSLFLIVRATLLSSPFQRRQTTVILIGMLLPWAGNFCYLSGWNPFPHLDLTPFGYTLSGLVTGWGLFYARLLDIVPVARDKVMEKMSDAVLVLDAQSRVVDMNPAAQALLQRPAMKTIGQPARELLVAYPNLLPYAERTTQVQAQVVLDPTVERANDTHRTYDLHISPLYNWQHQLTGCLWILHDVTTQKQAEEELRQAKEAAEAANRAKSAFLANMSHELRTPLNTILGFTDLAVVNPHISPQERQNLSIIRSSGEHLLGLINDVLDMAKIETGHMTLHKQNFDLHLLLQDMQNIFHLETDRKGLQMIFVREPAVPQYIYADEGKLRQVLINLLGNAVKFTQKGSITLQARFLVEQPPCIEFTLCDTGPGITPDELDTLFEPFVQTETGRQSHEGTGLGLAISRQFVQLMGGKIDVRSQVGQGTTFTFTLPIQVVQADHVTPPRALRRVVGLEPGQPEYRILIIDDNWNDRHLLVELLHLPGLDIREAENGQQAVDIWQTWHPHLIWMNMRIPILDGYEATRQIKARAAQDQSPPPVIVALTASIVEQDHTDIIKAGCDDLLCKPFAGADIFDQMNKHLGIRFVYEDTEQESVPQVTTLSDQQNISQVWLDQMRQATLRGDLVQMAQSIQQIQPTHPGQAAILSKLADNFEYDAILDWITRAQKDT